MSSRRLFSDVYKTHSLLLLLALFLGNCYAQISPNCVSSCGNIPIKHPFRVKADPKKCGNKKYELECEHDRLVLNLFSSGNYYVHAINYNNYTIRLVDVGLQQGNCSSLPHYSLSDLNFTNADNNQYALEFTAGVSFYEAAYIFYSDHPILWDVAVALWVDCEKPVKYRFYTESNTSASSCIDKATSSSLSSGEKRRYSYFLFGSLKLSNVTDQCKIDEIRITKLWLPADESQSNISYSDFHSKLEYGFELSWLSFLCSEKCPEEWQRCMAFEAFGVKIVSYRCSGGIRGEKRSKKVKAGNLVRTKALLVRTTKAGAKSEHAGKLARTSLSVVQTIGTNVFRLFLIKRFI